MKRMLAVTAALCVFTAQSVYAEAVTKRFGENFVCQVTNVTCDTSLARAFPDENYGAEPYLHFKAGPNPKEPWSRCKIQEIMIMRFDLSSIPPKTRIREARFRFFDNCVIPKETTLPIYKIVDPDKTGPWDPNQATYNRKDKDKNIPWSQSGTGDISTAIAPEKIGDLVEHCWYNVYEAPRGGQICCDSVLSPHAVQAWVDNPACNLGFLVSLDPDRDGKNNAVNRICSSKIPVKNSGKGLIFLRPYLEVTYESLTGQYETIPQPESVSAKYHSGQTFITWQEVRSDKQELTYRIYRSTKGPITDVNAPGVELLEEEWNGSSFVFIDSFYPTQERVGHTIVQPDLSKIGIELTHDTGLYVLPIEEPKPAHGYYAVTTVINGNENTKIGRNTADVQGERSDIPDAFPHAVTGRDPSMWTHVMYVGRHNPFDSKNRGNRSPAAPIPEPRFSAPGGKR